MDQSRIAHLAIPERLEGRSVVVVGLGSVGYPAMMHLAMGGVERFVLVDPDTLDDVNLVKHPARRADLGRAKVDVAKEWLLDRNPRVDVVSMTADALAPDVEDAMDAAIQEASAVVIATDGLASRLELARWCARHQTPAVIGTVFRTGFGGDAFLQMPPHTGCYECMLATSRQINLDRVIADGRGAPEVEAETEAKRYGLTPDRQFGLSGLSTDIALVASLVARVAFTAMLDAFPNKEYRARLPERSASLTRLESHMIESPFHVRGGQPPQRPADPTVWYDHDHDAFMGSAPTCTSCGSEVTPVHDRFCSWCGATVPEEAAATWFDLGTPDPVGVNMISVITRNHPVSDDPEDLGPGGRVRILSAPFVMSTRFIPAREGCSTCSSAPGGGGLE